MPICKPIRLLRGDAALAFYFANMHAEKNELVARLLVVAPGGNPFVLTRKQCNAVCEIAKEYGWKQ